MSCQNRQTGFSLIELMVAMLIGIMVTGGMVTVFSGSKRSSVLNTTLTELQESARFTMGAMITDIRLAGFQGCTPAANHGSPAVVLAANAPTANLQDSALTGHVIENDGDWNPPPPLGFTPPAAGEPGAPVPGTHALSAQYGSPETYRIERMATQFDPVKLSSATVKDMGVVENDLVLVSDCQAANIFTVSATGPDTLAHAASVNRNPATGGADGRLTTTFGPRYPGDDRMRPRVMRFEANIYYVGMTGRTNTQGEEVLALFRQSLPYVLPSTGDVVPPVEMVEGITDLHLRLGVELPPPDDEVRFVSPEDVAATPGEIGSVEVGILIESFDYVSDKADTRSYSIAGKTLQAGGNRSASTYRTDKRMRIAYNASVDIRNR